MTIRSNLRSLNFNVKERIVPLNSYELPTNSIYQQWGPSEDFRTELPSHMSISTMTTTFSNHAKDDESNPSRPPVKSSNVLMGIPIHVVASDEIDVSLINNLQATGLSLHFHGFEMEHSIHYDGVVGLTQCAISPQEQFKYNFIVDEAPGTYWYHTHSGALGIDSHNVIKGPLIVHPNTQESRTLVDELYASSITTATNHEEANNDNSSYRTLLSYSNDRILFFSDGFTSSTKSLEMYTMGGLFPPASLNDDGFFAATMEYQFGTINGKLREVVRVERGKTYKFRLLNGGSHFSYRIRIDGFPMTIVATDSTPVMPYTVDEIIIHNGERFDVEIDIPTLVDAETRNGASSVWIRADTQESRKQGYQNGIRAILHIVDDIDLHVDVHDHDVPDPITDIASTNSMTTTPVEELVTMNCYSAIEREKAAENGKGACLSITDLHPVNHEDDDIDTSLQHHDIDKYQSISTALRTVDFDSSNAPMHAYFTRVEFGNWYQSTLGNSHVMKPFFDPSQDLHPHTAIMNVPSFSPVIIIWRSKTILDHPMHLHGYKMEILEVFAAHREKDCNLVKCNLSNIFNSTEKITELEHIPYGTRPVKDTFILPAGGAVATRIFTRKPAQWFAHCHMDVHYQDGMNFVLNVENVQQDQDISTIDEAAFVNNLFPDSPAWLPEDFPSCHSPFLLARQKKHHHCDCYIDQDAVLDMTLDETYKCSRPYLCFHEKSQVATVTKDNVGGLKFQSTYSFPGWAISLIFVGVIAVLTILIMYFTEMPTLRSSIQCLPVASGSSWEQLQSLCIYQWYDYRIGTVSIMRVIEVVGIGLLTGILFEDVGSNGTATGLAEKTSLLFFSTTLWSQTRMYPAIEKYYDWMHRDFVDFQRKKYSFWAICMSRMIIVNISEAFWPFLFVACAYPLASMFGNVWTAFVIGILLMLNNVCYIAIGAMFGTLMPNISLGMIIATLFGQTTVICAGFFTELPQAVGWIRYISPIFYAFKAIVKSTYHWSDTYQCPKGVSAVGTNDCFLEQSAAIDDYKQRGINVATFGDPNSSQIYLEILMLLLLFCVFQVLIAARLVTSKICEESKTTSHNNKDGECALLGEGGSSDSTDCSRGINMMVGEETMHTVDITMHSLDMTMHSVNYL